MLRRIFKTAFANWLRPLREKLQQDWAWSVLASIVAFGFMYYTIGETGMRTEILITLSISGGIIATQLIRFLWSILLAPFNIIIMQDEIISVLKSIADRENVINQLVHLRARGVGLRNSGQTLMHQKSIDQWWQEHLDWRSNTANTISLLDKNLADNWTVLGTFTPRRDFPSALSQDHKHKLLMFDAWLERLDEVIEQLRNPTD